MPAVCPYCGVSVSRRAFVRPRRPCAACGTMIRPAARKTLAERLFVAAHLATVSITLLLAVAWRDPVLLLIPAGVLAAFLAAGWLLFPYLTHFETVDELPLCPVCHYDLRATPARCPECGTEFFRRSPPPGPSTNAHE